VPVFDGALKSNNLLEEAATFATLESPEDLATDGRSLFVADGGTVLRYEPGVAPSPAQAGGSPAASVVYSGAPAVTALACLRDGGPRPRPRRARAAHRRRSARRPPLGCRGRREDERRSTRSASRPDGRLLVTDGSLEHPVAHWRHDLMSLGRSGRLFELTPASGEARVLASGLAYAFGACAAGAETWVSESWSHRVRAYAGGKRGRAGHRLAARLPVAHLPRSRRRLLAHLLRPAHPARGVRAARARVQETHARRDRAAALDRPGAELGQHLPRADAGRAAEDDGRRQAVGAAALLRSGDPAHREGLVRYSLHSRFDGKHHGVVAAVECGGDLFVLAKGCRKILRLSVAGAERSLQS
jgi:hypothetical protein